MRTPLILPVIIAILLILTHCDEDENRNLRFQRDHPNRQRGRRRKKKQHNIQECKSRRLIESTSFHRELATVDEWPNNGQNVTNIDIIKSYCNPNWDSYFKSSVSDWNASDALNLTIIVPTFGCSQYFYLYYGAVNVVNGYFPWAGWEGVTHTYFQYVDGKYRIIAALAVVNDYYLWNYQCPQSSYDENRAQTMCHELGRAIGLKHHDLYFYNENTGSCMDYSVAPEGGIKYGIDFGPNNTQPSQQDYDDLENAYLNPQNRRYLPFKEENLNRRKRNRKVLGRLDLNNVGEKTSEVKCNGIVQSAFEKVDERHGTLTTTEFLSVEKDWD